MDIDFGQGVEDAWRDVASFVPKLVVFLIILIVGWFIAKLVARLVDGILERVGFDEAVTRGGIRTALSRSNLDASDLLAKLAKYFVLLLTLQFAFGVFGPNPISDMLNDIVSYLPNIFVAIIIVVIAAAIAAAVKELVEAALGGLSYGSLLANVASIVILVVGVFAAVDQLQIAPAIVTGLFYALLAMIVGVTVVGVGGAAVTELRPYLNRALNRADDATSEISSEAEGAEARMRSRVQARADQAGLDTQIAGSGGATTTADRPGGEA